MSVEVSQPGVRPVLIMAGGTGGHVFPALAVARELADRGVPVVWLGTRRGIEARVVPQAGIAIEWITVSGLRGTRFGRWLKAPFMLAYAAWQALRVLMRRRPCVVLGMGGFVTGPGGVMSRVIRRPLCIHEQNAVPGFTNRVLARIADCVLLAFPDGFAGCRRTRVVGNPVRKDIAGLPPPEVRFQDRSGALRLLVLGGSQGARALNEVVPAALAQMSEIERPTVRHQTGLRHLTDVEQVYDARGVSGELVAFVEDMASAYSWADLVLCRAGALTVAELAAAGLGSILVPYPHAVDDHQTRNAAFLVDGGAAKMIAQRDLTPSGLAQLLRGFLHDRARLLEMASAARRLAAPDAASAVADACMELAGDSRTVGGRA